MKKIPDYVVRVRLPDSCAFACCPSGDTEYEDAYNKAIAAVKPDGFEVISPRLGHKWPVDSEGYTWILLRCTDKKNVEAYWMQRAKEIELELIRIRDNIKKLI